MLGDQNESDTGATCPTRNFIDEDGIIRSIVLEDMGTQQAQGELAKILPADTAGV